MAGNTVTILDVAELAGVSPSAVSKVLTGKSVLDATREKVMAASKHLNYQPNAFAQGIRRLRCGNIGMVIFIGGPWAHELVFEILEFCTRKNIMLMIEKHTEQQTSLPKFISMVDGLIILGRCPQQFLDNLKNNGNPPLITADEFLNYQRSYTISIGEQLLTRKVVEYLVINGHKDIKIISPEADYIGLQQIIAEFKNTLIEFFGKCGTDQIILTPSSDNFEKLMQSGYDYTVKLLKSGKLPTALIYATDSQAVGGIVAVREASLRVPDDLSVITFSSDSERFLTIPLLTTIVYDRKFLSETLVEQLLKMIENPNACGKKDISASNLVNRGSVKNLNLN